MTLIVQLHPNNFPITAWWQKDHTIFNKEKVRIFFMSATITFYGVTK